MKQTIYIGPAIPGLVKKYAVFRDGLPEAVDKQKSGDENFARLLIPIDKVMEARKQLGTEGSVLAVSYKMVEKKLNPDG